MTQSQNCPLVSAFTVPCTHQHFKTFLSFIVNYVYELHVQMWACAQSAVPTEAGRSLAAGVSDSMCLTWVVETELGLPEE